MDFSRFEALTFDCYGTLIDWETGILGALRRLVREADPKILESFAELEAQAERGPFVPYRKVLNRVVHGFGKKFGFRPSPEQADSLADSIRFWRPFPDTVPALRRLKKRFKLGVISNVDDDLFAASADRLKVPFDWVVTAGQARSYKPDPRNFRLALRRLGLPKNRVLHVAQSLFHDVKPARALGLAVVWVNRRKGRPGFGATVPASARPDLEVPDLKTLAGLAGAVKVREDPAA